MASGSRSGRGRDERVPRSLEGLLKFSVENSTGSDEAQTAFQEMSEERKEWLKEVMSSFVQDDDVNKMRACLEIIQKPDEVGNDDEKVAEKERAFDALAMLTDGIDNAMDLHKIGGFKILVGFLNSSHSSLRWRAADVLAGCVQNNPYCQKAALELNVIPLLLELIDSDMSEQVKVKALYALSCLSRDFPEAESVLVEKDGFSVLMRAMQSGSSKLKVKSAFLLRHLMITSPSYKDVLLNMGMIEQLVVLLQQANEPFHEHVLNVLVNFTQECPKAVQECRRAEFNLDTLLREKVTQYKNEDPDRYEDEIRLCIELIKICKKPNTGSSSTVTI